MATAKVTRFAFTSCQNLLSRLDIDGGIYRLFLRKNKTFEEWEYKQFIGHAWHEKNLKRWWDDNRQNMFQNFTWMEKNSLLSAKFLSLPQIKKHTWSLRQRNNLTQWKCNIRILNHSFLETWYLLFILPKKSTLSKSDIDTMALEYTNIIPDLSASDQFTMPTIIEEEKNVSTSNIHRLTHDLRKPLSNLIINHEKISKMIEQKSDAINQNPQILKSAITRFGLQLKQMESFTYDLLHIGTGNHPSNKNLKNFSFLSILSEILSGLEDSFTMHKIKIESKLPNDFILKQNKELIYRILYNLISNAWQHCTSPGRIYIEVTLRGKWMKFDIEDSGKSPVLHDNTFELSQKNIGRSGGGWGIGLASSMKMAQEIGGKLTHRPSLFGKGVHFVLVLPDKK